MVVRSPCPHPCMSRSFIWILITHQAISGVVSCYLRWLLAPQARSLPLSNLTLTSYSGHSLHPFCLFLNTYDSDQELLPM